MSHKCDRETEATEKSVNSSLSSSWTSTEREPEFNLAAKKARKERAWLISANQNLSHRLLPSQAEAGIC